jgi:bacterioferritin-associated ferredoxin
MYICICNGHREHDIRQAAESGLRCAREIYTHLGKPPRCGRCLEVAAKVIDEVHASMAPDRGVDAVVEDAVLESA